jgi:hypothetical protein
MGSGGTKWDSGDTLTAARMNQKTVHVDSSAPATTYIGMLWYDTSTNSLMGRNAADAAFLYMGVPSGSILLWKGTIATIPTGWSLCNGSVGTPDLRDRFIVGATSDDAGAAKTNLTASLTQSGGAVTHHHGNHTLTQPAISNHTLTQPAVSAHTVTQPVLSDHTYTTLAARTSSASTIRAITAVTAHSFSTSVAVSAHTLSTNVDIDAHALTTSVAIDAHDTLSAPQPYYALAYIMRT